VASKGAADSDGEASKCAADGDGSVSKCAALAARVLISTFTSAQEREALRRELAKRRPLIAVFPAGIPAERELAPALAVAIREGWALAVSPQAPGSRLNKKIATWCNECLLKNAEEIWAGDISPNGMLAQMLAGLGRLKPPAPMKRGAEGREVPPATMESGVVGRAKPPATMESGVEGHVARNDLSKGAASAAREGGLK
jgi:hypothetical protein